MKRNNNTGMPRRQPAPNAEVGIDIGTSTVAVAGDDGVILKELFQKERPMTTRFICCNENFCDRSRRATNPANYICRRYRPAGCQVDLGTEQELHENKVSLEGPLPSSGGGIKKAFNKVMPMPS